MIIYTTRNCIKFILLIAIIILLYGCATTPVQIELAPDELNQDAKILTPPPGKGRVYIFMAEHFYEWAVKATDLPLYNNQGMLTHLGGKTFIKWDLNPGAIVIYDAMRQLFDSFYITEGQVLFFDWDTSLEDIAGVGWVWKIFSPISNEKARSRLQSLNMSLNKESDKREYFDWSSAECPVKGKILGSGFYSRGNTYFQGRKFEEAISDYSRVIELYPKLADLARLMRSLAYLSNDQMDKAISDFQGVINKSEILEIMGIYLWARLFDIEGKYSEALTYYQSFLALNMRHDAKSSEADKIHALAAFPLIGSMVSAIGVGIIREKYELWENEDTWIPDLPGEGVRNLAWLGKQVENRIKELQVITNKEVDTGQ